MIIKMSTAYYFQLVLNQMGLEKMSVEQEGDLVVEKTQEALKPPPLYVVIMLNDDYTPMDFVVEVLQKFFGFDLEKATQVMMLVHKQGKAKCGTYSKDVAETKSMQVNRYSRENQHPLLCEIQQAE